MKKHVVFALIALFALASAAIAVPRLPIKTTSPSLKTQVARPRLPQPTTIHGTIFIGSDWNQPGCNCDALTAVVAPLPAVLVEGVLTHIAWSKATGGAIKPGRSCEYSLTVPADKLHNLSVSIWSSSASGPYHSYYYDPLDLQNPFSMVAGGSVQYNMRVHYLREIPK